MKQPYKGFNMDRTISNLTFSQRRINYSPKQLK